jgi:hypothetical protein
VILLMIGWEKKGNEHEYEHEHECGWRRVFTPDSPMLGYRLDDAESAISVA